MSDIVPITTETALSGGNVHAFGDLTVQSISPIPSRGRRTAYENFAIQDADIKTYQDLSPYSIHQSIASRNETLSFQTTSISNIIWDSISPQTVNSNRDFTFTAELRVPIQPIVYIPNMAEVLKFGWIQVCIYVYVIIDRGILKNRHRLILYLYILLSFIYFSCIFHFFSTVSCTLYCLLLFC